MSQVNRVKRGLLLLVLAAVMSGCAWPVGGATRQRNERLRNPTPALASRPLGRQWGLESGELNCDC